MRTPSITLLLVSAALAATLRAEPVPEELPSFNETRTPTSPAFTLLGIAPTAVERPTTPSGVAFAVLDSTDDLSTLPKAAALEFSPYWLASHPDLTWRKDETRTPWESFLRTFTVSAATAQTGEEDAPVTSLAFGGRGSLWSGRLSTRAHDRLTALEATLKVEAGLFDEFRERLLAARRAELTSLLAVRLAAAPSETERDRALAEFAREFEKAKQDARPTVEADAGYKAAVAKARKAAEEAAEDEAVSLSGDREGLFVEVAGGGAWDFPDASWDARTLRQWGVWLTPSYVQPSWSAVGVARYLKKGGAEEGSSLDLGARLIYYRERYAVSAEYLRQIGRDGVASGDRFAGLFDYEVASGTWATVSVGQGLTPEGARTVVAQIGLAFNFSTKRYEF